MNGSATPSLELKQRNVLKARGVFVPYGRHHFLKSRLCSARRGVARRAREGTLMVCIDHWTGKTKLDMP